MEACDVHKLHLESQLHDIYLSIDDGVFSSDLHNERKHILREIANFERHVAGNVVQKAKVKWLVEGDENFVFFFMVR